MKTETFWKEMLRCRKWTNASMYCGSNDSWGTPPSFLWSGSNHKISSTSQKGFYSLTRQHGKYALVCLIQPWISSMEASLSASFMEIKRFSIEGFLSEIFRCYDEKNSTTLQWGAKHVRVRAKKICECGVVIEPSKTRADWRKPTS